MSLDKKFKEQFGAIGESGMQSYYGPAVEQRDKETLRLFSKWTIRDLYYNFCRIFRR